MIARLKNFLDGLTLIRNNHSLIKSIRKFKPIMQVFKQVLDLNGLSYLILSNDFQVVLI